MVIYNARTHRVTTIDGRETCPSACTKTMFVDPRTSQPMNYTVASDQPLSTDRETGVPGQVRLHAAGAIGPQPAPGISREPGPAADQFR
jgi:gamma-glutamyltranspeptidase